MSYKTVFVPALDEDSFDAPMEAAILYAKKFHSHIVVSHVLEPFSQYPPAVYYPLDAEAWAAARDQHEEAVDARAVALKRRYHGFLEKYDIQDTVFGASDTDNRISASWGEYSGDTERLICRNARVADLCFVQHKDYSKKTDKTAIQERLLTDTGRPLHLVPNDGVDEFPEHAVIGWNGSIETVRAITVSLPLLQLMKKVTLLSIGELDEYALDTAKAAAYLKTHDIMADIHRIENARETTGAQLKLTSTELHADIIIMGAYSHSRWREMIFGGVTRHLLQSGDMPVLMMH